MVLSNKKLKQKLRDAKAKLILASEVDRNNLTEKNSGNSQVLDLKNLSSLSSILNSEAQNPKLSKREKRRQKANKVNPEVVKDGDISGDVEQNKQAEPTSENAKSTKKKKKRKRDESEAQENVEAKKPKQLKKKKKNAKKKKPKKKVANGKVNEGEVEHNGITSTGEQIVAKIDASIYRKDVEISDKVYVGGIPYYSTEDDIRSYFEGCGTITCIDCMTFPDTGKFRGIAIITFKTEAAAKRALALDGSDMGGLFLKIQPFKSAKVNKSPNFAPSVLEGYNRIYIGNLSWDITENDLRKLFTNCTITSIRFGEDKESGEFKGYAHVDFADSLSLSTALRLDQKIVCGRPVKISCAVPKKGTVINGQVGNGTVNEKHTDNSANSKIRRRTCYECGEKGHLTSSCPKKTAADSINHEDTAVDSIKSPEDTVTNFMTRDDQVDNFKVSADDEYSINNSASSKIRRRTCYECGEKGHLSSACPKIKDADSTNEKLNAVGLIKSPEEETIAESEFVRRYNQVDHFKVSGGDENNIDNSMSSKIRRRTCYECGEKGHLSSACPKKQEAFSVNQKGNGINLTTSVEDEAVTKVEPMPRDDQVNRDAVIVPSSKIKRRNCYECGEKGHLSSSCPKKQGADSTNRGAA